MRKENKGKEKEKKTRLIPDNLANIEILFSSHKRTFLLSLVFKRSARKFKKFFFMHDQLTTSQSHVFIKLTLQVDHPKSSKPQCLHFTTIEHSADPGLTVK
jgi:hypothetical protein